MRNCRRHREVAQAGSEGKGWSSHQAGQPTPLDNGGGQRAYRGHVNLVMDYMPEDTPDAYGRDLATACDRTAWMAGLVFPSVGSDWRIGQASPESKSLNEWREQK